MVGNSQLDITQYLVAAQPSLFHIARHKLGVLYRPQQTRTDLDIVNSPRMLAEIDAEQAVQTISPVGRLTMEFMVDFMFHYRGT